MPEPPPLDHPFWKAWNVFTALNVRLFRLSGGRLGKRIPGPGRATILILHHVGRKSGQRRESPVYYVADGDQLAVIASKGGVDKHPAWFHNLMAAPETLVELSGGEKRRVRARRAEGAERERWWRLAVDAYPPYEDYQRYAGSREIPVVVLDPAG